MESTHQNWIEWRYYLREKKKCYSWSVFFLTMMVLSFFVDFGTTPTLIKVLMPVAHGGAGIWMAMVGRLYKREADRVSSK
jgi:hypothetical protein